MKAQPLALLLWASCAALALPAAAAPDGPMRPHGLLAGPVDQAAPASARLATRTRPSNPLQRIPRITAELVLGGATAAGMAYGGYQLGCALSGASFNSSKCTTAGFHGGVAGFSLGIPIGVLLGGSLLDGDGGVAPTLLGTGLGLATTVGGLLLLQRAAPDADPTPLVAVPLVFAVIAYELSSHDSRAAAQAETRGKRTAMRVVPSAAVARDGLALGVLLFLP